MVGLLRLAVCDEGRGGGVVQRWSVRDERHWIPAFAGMTAVGVGVVGFGFFRWSLNTSSNPHDDCWRRLQTRLVIADSLCKLVSLIRFLRHPDESQDPASFSGRRG
ncbi:hypothetical protein, partial [Herbaspirillum robiniae]|uniref:hypothetical protein n=1 Tax=Herbaspirillum robiniae TaxID=2014887 RepID=UPI001C308408